MTRVVGVIVFVVYTLFAILGLAYILDKTEGAWRIVVIVVVGLLVVVQGPRRFP